MIVLCGFSISNYYNKVKLVLLEKGIPFTEEHAPAGGQSEAQRAASPLGKIPYLRTEHGSLCESQVIVDYLEAAYPSPALVPADPWEAAKVRELCTFIDLHLELATRPLYAEAFFGGKVSQDTKDQVLRQLDKNLPAFKQLAAFAPHVAGASFSLADCAAWVHLPLIGMATRLIYGEDKVLAHGIDWKAYAKLIGDRPAARQVAADRKLAQEKMAKR